MEKRMVEFIRALRAAGVRISLAESEDALHGIESVGIRDADIFRTALAATLVKEHRDRPTFDYFFPLFFRNNQPPMQDVYDELTPEQREMLQQALQSLAGSMDALQQMMQNLLQGKPFDQDQLDQMGQMAGLQSGDEMYQRGWFERRMQRIAGMQQLQALMEQLLEALQEAGLNDDALAQLREMMQENMQGLNEQISNYVGQTLAENMAQRDPEDKPDLLDVPIQRLSSDDIDNIRDEVRRLAARLRTRAAMRQKRAKSGQFDPRRTMRQNMKYGGIPIEMKFRKRHKKPKLVLICDLSTSMRYMVEFLMTLVYQLQDQVQKTSSFVFIDDMIDVTMELNQRDSQDAVEKILMDNPPGYYSTDLGNSLNTFKQRHMSAVDHRATVIILGDGRNNYNNPRLDIHGDMQRKARRLFWFCPESPAQWGTGDSDMHLYANQADGVFLIRTLRDLANAVDDILAEGA